MHVLPMALLASLVAQVPSSSLDNSASTPRLPSPERIAINTNRAPAGTLRNGVLSLNLELRTGVWYPEADSGRSVTVQAFAEVGRPMQIPGPLIRVPEGTEIRATIRNTLRDSTLVVYGFHSRPGSTSDTVQIKGGAIRELRFKAGAPGTYFYWATTTDKDILGREWIDSQLSGAFIVDPAATGNHDDRIFVIGIWFQPADSSGAQPRAEREVLVINGKSWPHTERFTFSEGDSVRWRWVNPSAASHPMHLHGFYYRVDSRGSWAVDSTPADVVSRLANTELLLPGATMALRWSPSQPGNWIFHCHFAFHVSDHVVLGGEPALPEHVDGVMPHHAAVPSRAAVRTQNAPNQGTAASHPQHRMAGLVLGIHVRPHGTSTPARAKREPRNLRLVVASAPNRFGQKPALGFLLQEGNTELPPDSVTIPGPTLLLTRGEPVRITVVNRLSEQTGVHWHGIELESFPDGVPGWSGVPGRIMPPIAPADSFVAEFTPPRAGTFIYHSHANEGTQISSGMYGALVVLEPGAKLDPRTDRLIIAGGGGPAERPELNAPAFVNGSPGPPPMDLEVGVTYRLRIINIHPDWRVMFSMVTDTGFARWRPVAKDGADLPPSRQQMRPAHLLTGPGETADFEITPSSAGEMRLEVKTMLAGWHIPIVVRVREARAARM